MLKRLPTALVFLLLCACAGIDVQPDDTAEFAAEEHRYYAWRRPPLPQEGFRTDIAYQADPAIRAAVDRELQDKGYRMDSERADFLVDYLASMGTRDALTDADRSMASRFPKTVINRNMDQAMIDNAYALDGVRETKNIAIVVYDIGQRRAIWKVLISKLVEDTNEVNVSLIDRAVRLGLRTLPQAP